jgi:hypothetical protein
VDGNDVSRWFGEYASAFAACGRSERDTASLLAYFGVPLLLTTDDGFVALTSDDQVVAAVQRARSGIAPSARCIASRLRDGGLTFRFSGRA